MSRRGAKPKLTAVQVTEIRQELAILRRNNLRLATWRRLKAREYGVSEGPINQVIYELGAYST